MAPVILKMEERCNRCARKIINSIDRVYGVESVRVSPETGLVFVYGTADASTLQRLLEYRTGRPVTVVSDGDRRYPAHFEGMQHLGPPQAYHHPPPMLPYAYNGDWYNGGPVPSPAYHHNYHYAPVVDRQYVPNKAPVYFNDENPNSCCVQ